MAGSGDLGGDRRCHHGHQRLGLGADSRARPIEREVGPGGLVSQHLETHLSDGGRAHNSGVGDRRVHVGRRLPGPVAPRPSVRR